MIRSSVDKAKEDLVETMTKQIEKYSGKVTTASSYPAWQPNTASEILKVTIDVYEKLFDKEPSVEAMHAGLETAQLVHKYPEMDMISIGPTIRSPHSPDEKVNIKSVEKYWKYLVEILKNIPVK